MKTIYFFIRRRFNAGGFFTILFVLGLTSSHAQNTWTQKASIGKGGREGPAGFSIGGKGYMGTGSDGMGNFFNDFWEYDPDLNVWAQKADFGGAGRSESICFTIGGNGYIGTGFNGSYLKDLWAYDPDQNVWTQKADFGGTGRAFAIGFSIGEKGYAGTGLMWDGSEHYFVDFWEYDPLPDTWTQKADFGGGPRYVAVGFSIGNNGYAGTGQFFDGINVFTYKDFWEYDPLGNTWTEKADFGGDIRGDAVGFSIGNKGYLGTGDGMSVGYEKDLWEYDPELDVWTQKADLTGPARINSCGFSIDGKGYIGTGFYYDGGTIYLNDFWEYTPDAAVGIPEPAWTSSFSISPNPTNEKIIININLQHKESLTIKVLDLSTRELYSENIGNVCGTFSKQLDVRFLSGGTYLFQLIHNGKRETKKLVIPE